MEARKNPRLDLSRWSGLFFNIGLFLTMGMVVMAFEWKTIIEDPTVELTSNFSGEDWVPPVTTIDEPKPPQPKKVVVELVEVAPLEKDEPEVEYTFHTGDEPLVVPNLGPMEPEETGPEIFITVEEMPSSENFWTYVKKNLKYPNLAKRQDISGPVFLQFTVMPDGSVGDIQVLRGIGGGCDEEAVRVLKSAPKWKPGKQRGVAVPVRMSLAIHFKLQH
jgi:periplasmic protein TonB